MHVSQILLGSGRPGCGDRQPERLLRPAAEAQPAEAPGGKAGFEFIKLDVADRAGMAELFAKHRPDRVVHLAAQAGFVIPSRTRTPTSTATSSASPTSWRAAAITVSSIWPMRSSSSCSWWQHADALLEHHSVDHPISLYAATKKANELDGAHLPHLFNLLTRACASSPYGGCIGALPVAWSSFTKAIIEGPINVFNHGKDDSRLHPIDDIAEGVVRVLDRVATGDPPMTRWLADPARLSAPYRVFNIGNHAPIQLMSSRPLSNRWARKRSRTSCPCRTATCRPYARDVEELAQWTGFRPAMPVPEASSRFVKRHAGTTRSDPLSRSQTTSCSVPTSPMKRTE